MSRPEYKLSRVPNLKNPALIVGWSQDIGKLGPGVIDYFREKLGAEEFGRIETEGFAYLGGVQIEDNIIQFPESKFYCCPERSLLLFQSSLPRYDHYRFLGLVLDIAQQTGQVTELYTLGGIAALTAHTTPRRISTVVNQLQLQERLARYGLETGMNYQSAPGQPPSISSLLSWSAKKRNIPGVNLWTVTPFYMATVEDFAAIEYTLRFLDRRFTLNLDFSDLEASVAQQNEKISQLRQQNPDIGRYIGILERGIMLSDEENETLTREVSELFSGNN